MSQGDLFETREERGSNDRSRPPEVEKYKGAIMLSAIGDALGWPTEQAHNRIKSILPIRSFVAWKKLVGGRWWGYVDEVAPGEYSDDTQLTLAVARCMSDSGEFEPDSFTYAELPLWLHYERGGGRAVKAAARSIIRNRNEWIHNFYRQGNIEYRNAGANGAAMRNLPISLAAPNNERKIVSGSLLNTIPTHGHPRALLGTVLFGLAVRHALLLPTDRAEDLIDYLISSIEMAQSILCEDARLQRWVELWDRQQRRRETVRFWTIFEEAKQEAQRYLAAIPQFLGGPTENFYEFVGAFDEKTRGSGLSTVCAALYQYLRERENPIRAVLAAVNLIGTDTDTIAGFVGALMGARFGVDRIPLEFLEQVQDREYLLKTARRLHDLASGKLRNLTPIPRPLIREEAYLQILAWEIGLHEMFWDAIGIGGVVIHPTLGRGSIASKNVREIGRKGYVAKLIRIKFDSGQTCVFHSRVRDNEEVSESLLREMKLHSDLRTGPH